MEIERKYLVDLAKLNTSLLDAGVFIKQWYLQDAPLIRLRSSYDNATRNGIWTLTMKGKGLLSRPEINLPMAENDAHELLEMYSGIEVPFLQKTRHQIDIGDGLVAELDHFFGSPELYRFWLVEVELLRADQVFTKPDWFGKEVTEDPRYQNVNIVKFGVPTE